MSGWSNLFSGGSKSTSPPAWVQQAGKDIYGKAKAFYNKGYTPYTGQRVADFNSTQKDAFGAINDISNYDVADRNAAIANIPTMDNVGSVVDKYMNPYISGVVNPAVAQIERSAAGERQNIADSAFGAHAFGDARQGVRENELSRQTESAIGDTTGQLYAQGWDKAISDAMGASQMLSSQADAKDAAFLNREMAMLGTGNLQQQNAQSKLDTKYQAYQGRQQDAYDRLAALMPVIQGIPYTRTTTSSSNPLTDILKAIGGVAGGAMA